MKKHIITATALSSLLVMANAQAAVPTAELTVIGDLTVPSCTVASTDDGVYDFGKISATTLKPTAITTLTAQTKTWTIACDAETYLSFTPVDNRAASASVVAVSNFGMGMVNDTGKIGYFTASVSKPTVDGETVYLFSSNTATLSPYATTSMYTGYRTGWMTGTKNVLKSGKVFVADIAVTPTLASTATMNGPITDDTNIDGSLTLNFAFGI